MNAIIIIHPLMTLILLIRKHNTAPEEQKHARLYEVSTNTNIGSNKVYIVCSS